MMFIPLVFILVVGYILLKDKSDMFSNNSKNPSNILNERLAKGEISVEEYRELKQIQDNA